MALSRELNASGQSDKPCIFPHLEHWFAASDASENKHNLREVLRVFGPLFRHVMASHNQPGEPLFYVIMHIAFFLSFKDQEFATQSPRYSPTSTACRFARLRASKSGVTR
ncbi:MAG: hypothetical protein ACI8PT_001081 [Gammaproteobacteria bacterium]|jgi:hypothetical protein